MTGQKGFYQSELQQTHKLKCVEYNSKKIKEEEEEKEVWYSVKQRQLDVFVHVIKHLNKIKEILGILQHNSLNVTDYI